MYDAVDEGRPADGQADRQHNRRREERGSPQTSEVVSEIAQQPTASAGGSQHVGKTRPLGDAATQESDGPTPVLAPEPSVGLASTPGRDPVLVQLGELARELVALRRAESTLEQETREAPWPRDFVSRPSLSMHQASSSWAPTPSQRLKRACLDSLSRVIASGVSAK